MAAWRGVLKIVAKGTRSSATRHQVAKQPHRLVFLAFEVKRSVMRTSNDEKMLCCKGRLDIAVQAIWIFSHQVLLRSDAEATDAY
jgi:hypothetical protein